MMIVMSVQGASQGQRFFIRPKRFPLATILEFLALVFVLSSLSDRWALAPDGNVYGLDHWQGFVVLIAGSIGLPLAVARFFRVPFARSGWYFLPIALVAAAIVISATSFVLSHDVVEMNSSVPPEELDPNTVRADYVGLAMGFGVVFALVSIVHGFAVMTMLNHHGNLIPLVRSHRSRGIDTLEPELREDELLVNAWLVNLYGWITTGPRLARMTLTSERVVFVPPGAGRTYGLRAWLRAILNRYGRDRRPPLGEVIQIDLKDVETFRRDDGDRWAKFTTLVLSGGATAWGFHLVLESQFGVEADHQPHDAVSGEVEGAWRIARAGQTSAA